MAKGHRRPIPGERHVKRNALSRQVPEYHQQETLLRSLESRGELKGSCPVRWGAVGNTEYAVRWPPTQLSYPL